MSDGSMLMIMERRSNDTAGATIVRLLLSNHEIAAHLVISPATARTHVSRAMTKLATRDRAQLVVYAYRSGLVPVDT